VSIQASPPVRLPQWLRKPETHFFSVQALKRTLRCYNLHTVCESARCPNLHECFHRGTATFLILGDVCTRGCRFCSISTSSLYKQTSPVDPDEPENVARVAAHMGLKHVVITSVSRDDLPDGGAEHFARTVISVRQAIPEARVEVLVPDFGGNKDAVASVLEAKPHIFNHNIETVPRLYPYVRPQANYRRSLEVLRFAKRSCSEVISKSGLMAGLGEKPDEVRQVLRDLRDVEVDIVTIGQYLRPSLRNLPVAEYIHPKRFDSYRAYGLQLGFRIVSSGPFVRSSYMAEVEASASMEESS